MKVHEIWKCLREVGAIGLVAAAVFGMAACSDDSASSGGAGGGADPNDLAQCADVLETNADLARAMYADSITTVQALGQAIADFRAAVTVADGQTLDAAAADTAFATVKEAWLQAQEPYGFTEVYRFRGSPIDENPNEDGPADREILINAWPLGEGLIDYVVEGSDFGPNQVAVTEQSTGVDTPNPPNNIIGSEVAIDESLLENSTSAADERDVISGYHAIEFLLWGQDLNESEPVADAPRDATPGQRPVTDFVDGDECTSEGEVADDPTPCQRRQEYLTAANDYILALLQEVLADWEGDYGNRFTSPADVEECKGRLLEILTGMGTLSEGELAGERMQIALSSNSQEDEHSCFSDNTHRDIVTNAEGIYFLFLGDYPGYDSDLDGTYDATDNAVTGYGLDDYLEDLGFSSLAQDTDAAFQTTQDAYELIDADARGGLVFDNVIQAGANSDEAEPTRDTIVALNAQAQKLVEIADALQIDGDVIQDDASACDTTDPTMECP